MIIWTVNDIENLQEYTDSDGDMHLQHINFPKFQSYSLLLEEIQTLQRKPSIGGQNLHLNTIWLQLQTKILDKDN